MPVYRPQLATGEIYHIFNRGTGKRKIFSEEKDYFRFIHDIWEFNDVNAAKNIAFYLDHNHYRETFSIVEGNKPERVPRKLLVEILCFSLMPNHFHLLLRQLLDGGISLLMRKLGGYALYFNKKHNRVGTLFQGRFKAVLVKTGSQLAAVTDYIHLNRLELAEPRWKEKIFNPQKAMEFLETDRFSSYLDYIGKKNFPSVTSREFLTEIIGGSKEFKNNIEEKIFEQVKLNKLFENYGELFLE